MLGQMSTHPVAGGILLEVSLTWQPAIACTHLAIVTLKSQLALLALQGYGMPHQRVGMQHARIRQYLATGFRLCAKQQKKKGFHEGAHEDAGLATSHGLSPIIAIYLPAEHHVPSHLGTIGATC